MSLLDRRSEYSWGKTLLADLKVIPEAREYKLDETVRLKLGFRVVGGLRESFIPDVWTVSWEDNDKMVRLAMESSISRGGKKLASTGKEVRRGKFYWSRDPDLPYRIWAAIIHEDGSAPIIPVSVEDAKSQLLDVVKSFEIPAASLGRGTHKLTGSADVKWGRRTYIEKGSASGKSGAVELKIV
ncbi:MAG: hypothetical protein OK456_01750 [Thaumarchaeota archaeon]|nr:hypothetical protein [Nitrososphaerota archaeon]